MRDDGESWGLQKGPWDIWMEGFHIQGGGPEPARFVGRAEGETFRDACLTWFNAHPDSNFNPDSLCVWGCRLYSNEAEARKSFG